MIMNAKNKIINETFKNFLNVFFSQFRKSTSKAKEIYSQNILYLTKNIILKSHL